MGKTAIWGKPPFVGKGSSFFCKKKVQLLGVPPTFLGDYTSRERPLKGARSLPREGRGPSNFLMRGGARTFHLLGARIKTNRERRIQFERCMAEDVTLRGFELCFRARNWSPAESATARLPRIASWRWCTFPPACR